MKLNTSSLFLVDQPSNVTTQDSALIAQSRMELIAYLNLLSIHEFRVTPVGRFTLGLRQRKNSRKEAFSIAFREISRSVNSFTKESFVEVCLVLSINLSKVEICE